jgi:hypothetical protein
MEKISFYWMLDARFWMLDYSVPGIPLNIKYPVSNIKYRVLNRFPQRKNLRKNLIIVKALQVNGTGAAGGDA